MAAQAPGGVCFVTGLLFTASHLYTSCSLGATWCSGAVFGSVCFNTGLNFTYLMVHLLMGWVTHH